MATPAVDTNNNEPASAKNPAESENLFDVFSSIKEEDLVRGSTIVNIEPRCLELCRTYIAGPWARAKLEDIEVKRISGGFTNQLYKVQLKDSVKAEPDDDPEIPRSVAIKLYQAKHMNNYAANDAERLNDIIILSILSEVGIGPKVYGIFEGGFIQAFHPHKQFCGTHHKNPALVREVASTLARIHNLSVPVVKSANMLLKDLQKGICHAYENFEIENLVQELQLPSFAAKDLRTEYEDMLKLVEQIDCPTVFCHHDFRGVNILITDPEQKVSVVDLEYCGYGPRGYDFGTVFIDWGKEELLSDFVHLIPPEEDLRKFAEYYIEAAEKLNPGYSKKPENSVKRIVNETKLFYLVQHMFFMAVMIKQTESFVASLPFDRKMNLKSIEYVYSRYNQVKDELLKAGII